MDDEGLGDMPANDIVEANKSTLSELGEDILLLTPLVCDRRLTVAGSLLDARLGKYDGSECFNLNS